MRHKGSILMVVFALFLGFLVAPVWADRSALQTADPLEESYAQHVLPYYSVSPGTLSFAVFADASFGDGASPIHLFFFDSACNFKRDFTVHLTDNDLEVISLNTHPLLQGVIPTTGVIFADSGGFDATAVPTPGLAQPSFITYIILVNTADNTLTRIDSIPFSREQLARPLPLPAVPAGLPAHWTRYDAFNTIAATFGDVVGNNGPLGAIRTTLTFFNAVGTQKPLNPIVLPPYDNLLAFMSYYGFPRVGNWVPTAAGVVLIAYDDDENPLGSAHINPPCFLRLRLGDPLLFPFLGTVGATTNVGHIVASATSAVAAPVCFVGKCGFSIFQETVVENGNPPAGDLIFSGYAHHSNHHPTPFVP